MDIDTLVDEVKTTYNLSEDECLLLNLFIQTKGHSLSEYEYLVNAPLNCFQIKDKDIGAIMAALIGHTRAEIFDVSDKREYTLTKTFQEKLNNIEISYIAVVLFTNYGNAKEAKPSLDKIFEIENDEILYVYLALTPPKEFPKLRDRINAGKKTIFFMSHKSNFPECQKLYDDCIKEWIDFIKRYGDKQVEFYLVKNQKKGNEKKIDTYRFLYSSLLAQSTVRFNIYKYNKNGIVVTGIGNLLESQITDKHSLYDIVERAYIDVWNERIGIWKIDWKVYLKRLLANNFFGILFSSFMIFSAIIFIFRELDSIKSIFRLAESVNYRSLLDLLVNFISAMSIVGFLLSLCKQKITKIFFKQELSFRNNQK